MATQITYEIQVGVTDAIKDALEAACEFNGVKASQYARQALADRLAREGFMHRPTFRKFDNSIPQISEPAE
jgi:hypothetical protein